MAPVADYANHGGDAANATFHLGSSKKGQTGGSTGPVTSLLLTTTCDVLSGQEVLISYGASKPNAELLRDYGFTVEGNPHDRVSFTPLDEEASGSGDGAAAAAAAAREQWLWGGGEKQLVLPRGLNPATLLEVRGGARGARGGVKWGRQEEG